MTGMNDMKTRSCTTTCLKAKPQVSKIEVIRDGEAGRRGPRSRKGHFNFGRYLGT